MSEVKRYSAKVKGDPHYWDMVFASDYDALQSRLDAAEAECERLESLIKQYARRMCAAEDDLSALKAQQAGQEPVAWRMWNGKTWRFCYSDLHGKRGWEPLMTVAQHERILASWQRAQSAPVVPEGYVLVPQSMYLDAASIEAMAFVMGGPEEDDGSPTYCDCVMWVGEIDDDGVKRHGIHVYNTECEEEGSTTLAEFAAAPAQPAAQDQGEVQRLREALEKCVVLLERHHREALSVITSKWRVPPCPPRA